mmetsp:Transcript_42099/g.134505  ORF Transcript_42099/g.134505 Transcript_42099/m.134505 type:complete len:1859 (+) Transcript_42099:564-6140(+)
MYLVVLAVAISMGIMLTLGGYFKDGGIKSLWPLHVLRCIMYVFFSALYISSYKVLLSAFDCHLKDKKDGILNIPAGRNRLFPDEDCMEIPHLIHAGVALIASVLLTLGAYYFTWLDVDSNPDSRNLLATSSVHVSRKIVVYKALIGGGPILLAWHNKLATFIVMVLFLGMLVTLLKHAPYYNATMNRIYSALYALLLWGSLISQIYSWQHADTDALTMVLFAGAIPAMLAGWFAMVMRMRRPRRLAARFADDLSLAYAMDQFRDTLEVEIATRCMRVKDDGEPVDVFVDAAEALLRCGVAQFPKSAFLAIVQANFLIEMRGKYQEGQRGLEKARKLPMTMSEKFQVYARLEYLKEAAMGSTTTEGIGGNMNYTEFEAHFKMLTHVHMAAMRAVRRFWRELSQKDVKFRSLETVLGRMAKAEQRAMQTYRTMLEHYPKSVKVMRAYGRFLEDIRNDPTSASRYFSEAYRLEDELAEAHREAQLASLATMGGEGSGANMAQQILDDDHPEAIIVISRFGIINIMNKQACKIFGYNKNELVSKNIMQLMPEPFSMMHNSFLLNYCRSGIPRILDSTREVVGIHKNYNIFPVNIVVSVVEYNDEDHFMGIVKSKPEDPTTSVLYCTGTGVIMCANRVFSDMFGFVAQDVVGKNMTHFCQEVEELKECMERILENFKINEEDNELRTRATVLHAYDLPILSDVLIRVGGTTNHKILIFEFCQEGGLGGICTFQVSGKIKDYNRAFAEMLGYRHGELSGGDLSMVMPTAYSLLHTKYMKNTEPAPDGCKGGRLVELVGKGGQKVPSHLQVAERRKGKTGTKVFAVMAKPSTAAELDAPKLLSLTMHFNGLISSVDHGFESLGLDPDVYQPEQLNGMPISNLVHVVDDRLVFVHGPDAVAATDPTVWLQPILLHMMDESRKGIVAWRTSLRPIPSAPPIPAAMVLHQEAGTQGMVTVNIYRADRIEGLLEVNENLFVSSADLPVAYMAGLTGRQIEDLPLSQIMPAAAPTGKAHELVGANVKGGGTKSKIVVGPKRLTHITHQDGSTVPVNIEVAMQPKDRRAGVARLKYYVRILSVAGTKGDMFDPSKPWGNASAKHKKSHALTVVKDEGKDGAASEAAQAKDGETRARGVRFGNDDDDDEDAGGETKALVLRGSPRGSGGASGPFSNLNDDMAGALVPVDAAPDKDDQAESEMTSEASDPDRHASNFYMAKRLKKVMKILKAQQARSGMMKMRGVITKILLLLLVVHVACFAVVRIFSNGSKAQVGRVQDAGRASVISMEMAISARLLASAASNRTGSYPHSITPGEISRLNELATGFEDIQHSLFLDSGSLSGDLRDLYEQSRIPSQQLDLSQGEASLITVNRGLWEISNSYVANAREVATDVHPSGQANSSAPWVFVIKNGPGVLAENMSIALALFTDMAMDSVDTLCVLLLALLVVEVVAIAPSCLFFLGRLLRRVALERLQLFSVFLMVPKPTLVALANRDVSRSLLEEPGAGGEGGEVDEDDDALAHIDSAAGGGGTIKFNLAKGRKMQNYSLDVYALAFPIVVWMMALLGVYVTSYFQHKAAIHSIVDLRYADSVRYYAERVRFFANEMVLSTTPADVEINRAKIVEARAALQDEYEALVYGSKAFDTEGSVLESQHGSLLYKHDYCLRKDPAGCFPADHPFHVTTHQGLNDMVREYLWNAHLLSTDPVPALGLQNQRYQYVWQVGQYDLYDGLEESADLFETDTGAGAKVESLLSALMLCLLIIGGLLYYQFMFKPFVARGTAQMRRVAELLTQLPEEIDVVALVQTAGMGKGVDVSDEALEAAVQQGQQQGGRQPQGRAAGLMGSLMNGVRRVSPLDGGNNYRGGRGGSAHKYGV